MHPIRRAFKLMTRKTKIAFFGVLIITALEAASTLAAPQVTKELINSVFVDKVLSDLWYLLGIAIGLAVAKGIFLFSQRYVNEYIAQNVIYTIRTKLYSKIQRQSIDFFDRIESGQLISRGTSDVYAIRLLLSQGLRIFLRAILLYVGIFIAIGIEDLIFVAIFGTAAPILFTVMYVYTRQNRPLFQQIQNKFGELNVVLTENIRGSRVVRAFANEERELMKFEEKNEEHMKLNLKRSRLRSLVNTVFPFVLSFASFILLYIGGKQVLSGALMIGTLVAVYGYLVLLRVPTRNLSYAIMNYQEGTAALNRIYEIIDMEKKIKNKPGAIDLTDVKGNIKFDNITFAYRENEKPILKNISLEIKAGETVAFLGTTGSGKSTIVSMVPRFYDPQIGAIYIDGNDLRDLKVESLRLQIALVQQEAFLFARTIRENIAFGRPDATEEEIIRAAKIAQAHDFIMDTPDGYDTVVGERGTTLSGGQKQRLTIARALILGCPFLIMDDSSSALDFETEHQFQQAVDELIKNRTTLIVTQRLSTIKFATKIVVLDKGKIVEIGTHEELIVKNGLYTYLYNSQLIGQEESFDSLEFADKEKIKKKSKSKGAEKK